MLLKSVPRETFRLRGNLDSFTRFVLFPKNITVRSRVGVLWFLAASGVFYARVQLLYDCPLFLHVVASLDLAVLRLVSQASFAHKQVLAQQ